MDHLVAWVEEYLVLVHGETRALHYIQEIDRRYCLFSLSFQYKVNARAAFLQYHLSLVSDAFQMVVISHNGQVMIRRR
jgi:hypothetical protein